MKFENLSLAILINFYRKKKKLNLLFSELEQVPDLARRPEPEEKLAVNKPNTRNYSVSNLGKTHKPFWG